jgi:SWIM zinc finger
MPTRQPTRRRSGRRVAPVTCTAAYTLACELRAEDEHHAHRWIDADTIEVKADSQAGWYRVGLTGAAAGVLAFTCTCPSGQYRPHFPVPCKHAARFARLLEAEGRAVWQDGMWRPVLQPV